MKVFIAADHLGVDLKHKIIEHLMNNGIEVGEIDLDNSETDDYPDFAFKLGNFVVNNKGSIGVLICGNGIGMSIAANKVKGIRCIRAVDTNDAYKGKNHNGANVLAIGSNLEENLALEIVDTFITTKPASIDRHLRRIDKIIKYENGEYNEL